MREADIKFNSACNSDIGIAFHDSGEGKAFANFVLADEFQRDGFKSLAVHTRHLFDRTFVGANFSDSSARARCNRDRTVPTAHPNTRAAS